ncbi:MAG: serine acetyltransferase [Lachnospiraceae bacterium]|nr:serine acetyltransferase [Lachnospiraceae bacterium]
MIQTKEQLRHVLDIEEQIYGKKWYYNLPVLLTEYQILYKHMKYLRKAEYAANNRKLSRYWYLVKLLRIQTRYGISIPLNVVEEGFEIVHLGSVIINAKAKVGKYCRVHPGVVIGANHDKAPVIGAHVYIGPGAKVFGDIQVADEVQIGANAVLTKSCEEKGAVLAGVPAARIKSRD